MISIGFTGTKENINEFQKKELRKAIGYLISAGAREFHHGDCVGADTEFHLIVKSFKTDFPDIKIVVHPPLLPHLRSFCDGDEIRPKRDYLDRNGDIVNESIFLLSATKGEYEELRSGTWSTIRRARKKGNRILIITPTKTIKENA